MARARNIKPGFFKNEDLAELEPIARILFSGLWCLADREGRLEDRPKRIKAEILPYDNCEVDKLLNQLAESKFIIRYVVDGEDYIQIINFKKHQNPHMREAPSIIPPPNSKKHSESTVLDSDENRTSPADSLNLNTDSFNLIPKEEYPADLTQTERECLNVLKTTPSYPFNFETDLKLVRGLLIEFPDTNLLEELKKWAHRKKFDQPLDKNSKPRGQIRNWLLKAKDFKKPRPEQVRGPTLKVVSGKFNDLYSS